MLLLVYLVPSNLFVLDIDTKHGKMVLIRLWFGIDDSALYTVSLHREVCILCFCAGKTTTSCLTGLDTRGKADTLSFP